MKTFMLNDGTEIKFTYNTYLCDKSTYIGIMTTDEEPYASASVNLLAYGYHPAPDEVYLGNDLDIELKKIFTEALVEKVLKKISYGPYGVKTELVKLKENWKDVCEELI